MFILLLARLMQENLLWSKCWRKSTMKNLTDWKEFVTRTPEEYTRWVYNVGRAAEFEIAELLSISKEKKIIVDTNITP